MSSPERILFISQSASQSGAPIILLRFMRWLRQNTTCRATCILLGSGKLVSEFSALYPTSNLQNNAWRNRTFKRRLLNRVGLSTVGAWLFVRTAMRGQFRENDLIYCNTIDALRIFDFLPQIKGRVICHVHELEYAIRVLSGGLTNERLKRVHRFIACSQCVADNLASRHSVSPKRIDVVHEFVPSLEYSEDITVKSRGWLRSVLNIGPNTMIIGGSGQFGWRKGTDLFVQVANQVRRLQSRLDVRFVWLGGDLRDQTGREFVRDIELSQLEDYVTIIPPQDNPLDYFAGFDLFILTSREDPYPLVCLEAAAFGVPIACFERSGGMPEFVLDDAGVVVPYLDVNAMAAAVIELLHDDQRRQQYGCAARQKVHGRHTVDIACPEILAAMQKAMTFSK